MPLIWTHVLFFQFLILISLEVEIIKIVRCQSIKSSGLRTLVCFYLFNFGVVHHGNIDKASSKRKTIKYV